MTLPSLLTGVRAVVFDAVGTLIHPHPPALLVYAEVGRRHGSRLTIDDLAARFKAAFGREEAFDEQHAWRTSEERETRRWRHIVQNVFEDLPDGEACFQELFAHFGRAEAWRCDPEADHVLAALAGGVTVALASNYDRRLHSVAQGIGPLRRLSRQFISSEIGWRKPAPEFFLAVCDQLGLPPGQVAYVGDDRRNDYEGARGAGLRAVLLDSGSQAAGGEAPTIHRLGELLGGLERFANGCSEG